MTVILNPYAVLMKLTVTFADEARDWIAQNLAQGCDPQALAHQLMSHRVEPELAQAMVSAVSHALTHGRPLPQGSLTLGEALPTHQPDPPRLHAGHEIQAGERKIRVLSRMEKPCIALLADVFDADECRQLISLARPRLDRSTVVDPFTGQDRVADHRNSAGMFFATMESALIERLERRIAALTGHPVEHGEGLQVLNYPTGARSTPHFDYLMPTNAANRASVARSGQRVATLIVYLNDVPAGGETHFDHLGLSVIPRRGQAVYFEYGNQHGHTDPLSLHSGAPVTRGEKWIATKWIRQRPFVPASPHASLSPAMSVSSG